MDTQDIQNQAPAQNENENAFARLDFLFSQIPDHVYAWLFSEQTAMNVAALAKQFSLNDVQTVQLARITGLAIIKDISLPAMTLELKKSLSLDDAAIRQLAVSIALAQFLPIRDHLISVEDFIRQLGGSLPAVLPPLLKSSPTINYPVVTPSSAPTSTITLAQKTLRQIVQENKEVLNQTLTAAPLKIADFDQLVRGTIKNWLADYVKQKGAERHDQMVRGDYLFKSDNTKKLSPQEKLLVAEILKSYDENSTLNYNEERKIIILENIEKNPPQIPEKSAPVATGTNSSPIYREPIEKKDLSDPVIPPPKTTPQINGRVINLKDLQ